MGRRPSVKREREISRSQRARENVHVLNAVDGTCRPATESATVVTGDDGLRLTRGLPTNERRGDDFHLGGIAIFTAP